MPVDNDHAVRDATGRRSVLVSRRTAAELSGLSLPQVDYWIRRGVVGTGGSGSRWVPRKRTTVDALALAVAVELRSRGVSVREIQAVLPVVLADRPEWHPMAELVDVDALQARISAATAKVTTATVPAVPAVPDEEPPPPPRRRLPRAAVVAAAVVLAVATAAVIVLNLAAGRASDPPPAPPLPDAVVPPAVPTSAPAAGPLVLPPAQRAPVVGAPPTVVAPSLPAAPPVTPAAPPPAAVTPPATSAAAPAQKAPDQPAPDDAAAQREQSRTPPGTGGQQPSGDPLRTAVDQLFGR
jgi:hypothetical protein